MTEKPETAPDGADFPASCRAAARPAALKGIAGAPLPADLKAARFGPGNRARPGRRAHPVNGSRKAGISVSDLKNAVFDFFLHPC